MSRCPGTCSCPSMKTLRMKPPASGGFDATAALTTPGTEAATSMDCFNSGKPRSGPICCEPRLMPITKSLSVSNPASIRCACCILRTNRPALTSATSASATCDTTSTPRIRPPPIPPAPWRPPCLSTSFRSGSDSFQAGMTPKTIPVRTETPSVNSRTVGSSARSTASSLRKGGRNAQSMSRAQNATSNALGACAVGRFSARRITRDGDRSVSVTGEWAFWTPRRRWVRHGCLNRPSFGLICGRYPCHQAA